MTDSPRIFANIELYANVAAAIDALQLTRDASSLPRPPLPEWAKAPEVVDIGGVTRLRPDDVAIRNEQNVDSRPGSRYLNLVRDYGRDRLVLDLTNIRPFGHPFHDDIFVILRALGQVGGRLAVCGAYGPYIEFLEKMYKIRVVRVSPGI